MFTVADTLVSKTLSVPVGKPTEVGAKFTQISQVPPMAMVALAVQVVTPVLIVKGPLIDNGVLFSLSAAVVLLVRVILVGPLVVPTGVAAKDSELGVKVTELAPVPVIPTI